MVCLLVAYSLLAETKPNFCAFHSEIRLGLTRNNLQYRLNLLKKDSNLGLQNHVQTQAYNYWSVQNKVRHETVEDLPNPP